MNGAELSSKLNIIRKESKHNKFMKISKFDGSTKELKRILILVGKIYDNIVLYGSCEFICCWYNNYRHNTIKSIVPHHLLNDSIHVLTKIIKVRLDNGGGNMLIIGKYGVLKPLMLVWKKGSMQGFPRDVIRYLSQWL